MKRIILLSIGFLLFVNIIAQSKITFYSQNGSKEITTVKCGEFDNIKIKFKVPANVKDFDLIKLRVFPSSINNSAGIFYNGAGSISTLASTSTLEKWILKPGKQNGDFNFPGSGNLGIMDLCEYPHEKGMKQLELDIELAGYNKTGSETYWDKWDKVYKTRPVYSKGTLLASGKLTIIQLPPQTEYVSTNGLISISKVVEKPSDEALRGIQQNNNSQSKMSRFMQSKNDGDYEIMTANLMELSGKGHAVVSFVMFKNTEIAQKMNVEPSQAYEQLKHDLLQQFAYNSYNMTYQKPTVKWPDCIQEQFCPDISSAEKPKGKKKKKSFLNTLAATATNSGNSNSGGTQLISNDSYWHKEKIGDYEYDVLRIPNTYGGVSINHFDRQKKEWYSSKTNSDVPAELVIYAYQKGDYSVFIIPTYTDHNSQNVFLHNEDPQKAAYEKEFVEKTLASIKFH